MVVYSFLFSVDIGTHHWCNWESACLECGRSWVWAQVVSSQSLWNWYLLLLC